MNSITGFGSGSARFCFTNFSIEEINEAGFFVNFTENLSAEFSNFLEITLFIGKKIILKRMRYKRIRGNTVISSTPV